MNGQNTYIGWIDFSEDDLRKAREYLNSLESGTIDELGFGIMRDGFSEIFYPATNTVMNYSKFFIFVPSIYLHIEKRKIHGSDAAEKCRTMEEQLRIRLSANNEIYIRKVSLQRYPSNIYWTSLSKLRIFEKDGWTQSYYHNHMVEMYMNRNSGMKDDDGNIHDIDGEIYSHWDHVFETLFDDEKVSKPNSRGSFPDDIKLALNRSEAQYLKDRYIALSERMDKGTSFFKHYLSNKKKALISFPWDTTGIGYPIPIEREVKNAKFLSMVAKGATILYYLMLLEMKGSIDLSEISETFEMWWSVAKEEICEWDMNDYFDLTKEMGTCRWGDEPFIRSFVQNMEAIESASLFINNSDVRDLIHKRERQKKSNRARLDNRKYLNQWEYTSFSNEPEVIGSLFDFRTGIGTRFINEIIDGTNNKAS